MTIFCGRRRLVFDVRPTVFLLILFDSGLGLLEFGLDQLIHVVVQRLRWIHQVKALDDHRHFLSGLFNNFRLVALFIAALICLD